MHPKKSIIFVAVAGTVLLLGACSEEAGPSGPVSAPDGVTVTNEGTAADQGLPVRFLDRQRDVPLHPEWNRQSTIDDECCEEVGQAHECWIEDAENDGVTCTADGECPSGNCNEAEGLCICDPDLVAPQCNEGVCTEAGLCGPSWCNGYMICSCWGGCIEANEGVSPETLCDDLADLGCCEGTYPVQPETEDDPAGSGYCSDDPSCLGGCTSNDDCEDGNACTNDICDTVSGDCSFPDVDCSVADDQCNIGVCEPDGLSYNCVPLPIDDGTDCNADNNGCTQYDACVAGECVPGDAPSCNDLNVCTGPDVCVDVPDGDMENTYTCSTPAQPDGNATLYGYVDSTPCVDFYCISGMLGPVPVNCDAMDNLCNNYSCNPAGAEDNCTNTMQIGTACNADSNLCTTPDTCQDGNFDGTAECTAGAAVVCTPPSSVCLASTCNPASGACDISVVNGIGCEEDGNPCTVGMCGGGFCVEAAVDCSALSDQCHNGVCQPDGLGGYDCVAQNVVNGTACNADSTGCTQNDTCQSGTCTPGAAPTCNDTNVCTSDACQSTGINTYVCAYTNLPSTTTCNADGSGCTVGDHCNGSGACVTGTAVTPAACMTALGANTDCNTAHCQSTSATTYTCVADPLTLPAGTYCNNDSNGCTLDYCQDTGPTPGAECNTGPARNCSALNNLPCRTGVCVASSFYASSCQPSYAVSTTACNFDSNGCTVGDHCNGAGACVAGTAATCTPPSACFTSACSSTGSSSYSCVNTAIPSCCMSGSDCATLACPGADSPVGCSIPACDGATHQCYCNNSAVGTACTDIDEATYPPNCYDATCNATGNCVPTMHAAYNNLCSDLFVAPAGTTLDTAQDGYLGSFSNTGTITAGPDATVTGTKLAITGSTLCAQNNYRATGNYCTEEDGTTRIGNGGKDLVYAFRYQTNSSAQFLLYSYVVKVEANYDVGLYVRTDIDTAASCPEGNNPTADYNPTIDVASAACHYPYDDNLWPDYIPTVIEDDCNESGNTFYDQECCDPCTEGGSCGYKWCERGYPDGCNMCTTGCTGIWEYPEDPFNCNSELPGDPGYSSYTYMASSIVSPRGATDGTWRTVFIYMDGVAAATGNFYLTIERERWYASPCDRVNDDPRVYDVTHPGTGGSTYLGSLENVVNSMHAGGVSTTCGGYDCWSGWAGKTACHQGGLDAWGDPVSPFPNQFWPNQEHFKIHRSVAEGPGVYCFETNEAVAGAADLVMSMWRRDPWGGPTTICDQSYYDEGCRRNNSGNNVMWRVDAAANELYLIEVSTYTQLTAPCTANCNYSLKVTEGPCPVTCSGVLGESPTGSTPVNLSAVNGVWNYGTVGSGYANNYFPPTGWPDGRDAVWAFVNNTGATRSVTVTYCANDGAGFDVALGIYNCMNVALAGRDAAGTGYWGSGCETITRNMANGEVWYVDADSYSGWYGSYMLRLSY